MYLSKHTILLRMDTLMHLAVTPTRLRSVCIRRLCWYYRMQRRELPVGATLLLRRCVVSYPVSVPWLHPYH